MKALAAEEHSELHDRARVPYILCYIWTVVVCDMYVICGHFHNRVRGDRGWKGWSSLFIAFFC